MKKIYKSFLGIVVAFTVMLTMMPQLTQPVYADDPKAITTVDIGNIWTWLDTVNVVPFTTEVHPELDSDGIDFNDKMEIYDEDWTSDHVINKRNGSGIPKIGKTYSYSIVLKAKAGWKFTDNFTFIYGGSKMTRYEKDIWDDGTYLKLSGFIDPVTVKAANPLKISGKTATIKYSKLKKKSQTIAVTKVIKFTNDAKDKKTYTLSSAKKGKKGFKKFFKVNKKTGKVTVKKGLKKGIYKVKVKVSAAGNTKYKASNVKTVTFKVKVK